MLVVLLLVGCEGGAGRASGELELGGERLVFDGGAVALDLEVRGGDSAAVTVRAVAISTLGRGFDCAWAAFRFGASARDLDRPGTHHELVWRGIAPDEVMVEETTEGLLGASEGGTLAILDAEMTFEDRAETIGTLVTPRGAVAFEALDCGAL